MIPSLTRPGPKPGVACPSCGSVVTTANHSKATRYGRVRYRSCGDGHTFSTFEAFAVGSVSVLSGTEVVRK